MTEGRIFGKMLLFILPLMATNLLQMLYNAADMMVVSLSPELDAVGAIGITGPFVGMLVNIFIGFSVGANVMVARHLGARNDNGVKTTVHTAIVISVIFGIAAGAVGIAVARPVLSLMGAEGKLLELATTYTIIYFIGMPFISVTNYSVAILRAKGDTRTPLYVLSLAGLVNVMLNLFFVLVCGLSVEGVAIATAVSNLLSAIALIIKLTRDDGPCRLDIHALKIDKDAFLWILKVGLPAGLQGALFSISNIMIQSSILRVNNMLAPTGSKFAPVVQGNAAVSNLNSFIYTSVNAVYQASITFTSQNVGAGKYSRIPRVMISSYSLSLIVALVMSTAVLAFHRPLIALYGVTDGAEGTLQHIAYETAYTKLCIETMTYFLLALMDVGSGIVRGMGKSLTSTVIALIGSCLLRIVWLLTVFEAYLNVASIYMSYPVSWLLTGLAQFTVALIILRRARRRYPEPSIAPAA